MDKELRQNLTAYIAERLAKEVKNIKRMSVSTADDYGNNLSYFNKMLNEELDKVITSKNNSQMKYRYTITANGLYIPQYKKEGGSEWVTIKKDMVTGELLKVCEVLGSLSDNYSSFMGYPLRGEWVFHKDHENESVRNAVYFTKKIYIMAFIGAAQHWWGHFEIKEVGDVLK
jgi:hypothetical protein